VISAAVPNATAAVFPVYCRSRSSVPASASSRRKCGGVRRAAGSVSGRNQLRAPRTSPSAASAPKMPRQSVNRRIWPPSTGASTGARPKTRVSEPSTRASSLPSYMSRTMARLSTTPVAPAAPCRKRKMMSVTTSGETVQATLSAVKAASPISSGRRRP
jgi:hypothetical protein